MNKKYSVEVWDIQFYKIDENGDELLNDDGSIKLFTGNHNMDCSYLAEGVDDDDLEEIES
tara:strand:- start:58 stop:237 length:180 start_codon:yes stop_codon:yes gene_type:complete